MKKNRQRIYAGLLALGACILLFRTTTMVVQGALGILQPWVGFLLILELLIDLACLLFCIKWFLRDDAKYDRVPLRLATAAAFLHALRVLVFVLGKTEGFHNFDVRPEHYEEHAETWTWFGVWLAAILSILGVIGVIVIWRLRRRAGR
jgi:hypothetical protein